MEALLNILTDLHPDVDFDTGTTRRRDFRNSSSHSTR